MNSVPWRRWYLLGGFVGGSLDRVRAFGRNVVDQRVSWFLISVLVIVVLMFIFLAKAVLPTSVAIENKHQLEQRFEEPAREYEREIIERR